MDGTHTLQPSSSHRRNIRIALLEDDLLLTDLVTTTLTQAGWGCCHFTSIAAICSALRDEAFDLLVLDWSLPDGDADTVIRLARRLYGWDLPILIESVNGNEQLIVRALEMGANDYVVKPLRLAEVRARITALLRGRSAEIAVTPTCGPYRIDVAKGELTLYDHPIPMTPLELHLISYLFQHAGELLSRETLLRDVWGTAADLETRTVDVYIGRLRRKLKLESHGIYITTLHGYGYRLDTGGLAS